MIGFAGTIVDDMVELLCANLQRDDLAAINTSLSTDDTTAAAKEALLKVLAHSPQASCFKTCFRIITPTYPD